MAGNNNKKNMGKVKHYRHSFYSGPQRVKRVALVILGVALLFTLGWFIAPHVIDFGTRTWYSITRGDGNSGSSAQSIAPESSSEPEATPAPSPTPVPTPVPSQVQEGSWSFISLSSIDTAEKADATAAQLAADGVKYAVIPLKDEQGYIYYASGVPTAAQSVAATTINASAAAKAFEKAGIVPVAQLCAFQDPKALYADRSMGVRYQTSEYFWLDAAAEAGGKPWLDPYAPTTQDFINALLREVRTMGFDQILLSGVQFPNSDTANAGYQNTGNVPKPQQLAALIDQWQKQAKENGGVLWIEYTLAQAAGKQPAPLGGGTLEELGVQNLVLRTGKNDDPEAAAEMLEAARAAAKAGGAEHLVLRAGNEAHFDQ